MKPQRRHALLSLLCDSMREVLHAAKPSEFQYLGIVGVFLMEA